MDVIVGRIKPLLDSISKSPNAEAIEALLLELEQADGNFLQYFQNIILVGIITIIKSSPNLRLEYKTNLIKCMYTVIGKTKLQKSIQFDSILKCMIFEIYDQAGGNIRPGLSEELKLAVLHCITCSSQNLDVDVVEEYYVKPKVVVLAQGFFICVEVIFKEKYRKLRQAAIKCIMSLMQVHDGVEYDLVLRHQIAGCLFVILPKTIAALVSVIQGDEKQGQPLMAEALKTFGRVVCLIMQDFKVQPEDQNLSVAAFRAVFDKNASSASKDDDVLGIHMRNQTKKREYFESIERTDDWLQAAARKLVPTIKLLAIIRGSHSQLVRQQLAVLSSLLIEFCSQNMRCSLPDLLENLIALSYDVNEETATVARRSLQHFIDSQQYLEVWLELETLFYNHMLTIPRIMNQCEEKAQFAAISLLHGYLKFLTNDRLCVIVNQQHILEYLVKALLACAELELPLELLDIVYTVPGIDETPQQHNLSWKRFKHLKNKLVEDEFHMMCRSIGQSVVFERVAGYILDNLLENVSACNEFLVVLVEICLGVERQSYKPSIEAILDELTNELHWNLEIRPNQKIRIGQDETGEAKWFEDRIEGVYESATEIRVRDIPYIPFGDDDDIVDDVVTINDAKFNVLHECLALEMVGNGALALSADFERYLFKFLHIILEKAGSYNTHIQNAGHYALTAIAKALAFRTTAELIFENSNFFIYFINKSMKLRHYNSSGLDILSVVLKYSTLDSISYLEDMVRSVLDELSTHQRKDVTASLRIFNVFIDSVNRWNVVNEKVNESPVQEAGNNILGKWLAILNRTNDPPMDLYDSKTAQEMYEEDMQQKTNEKDENEMHDYPRDPEKEPLPKHIELARDILLCCLKYIPSSNVDEQAMAVKTVNDGLKLLKDHENELLPLVHQIWYPLTERFKDSDPIVVSRCFDLLLTMGDCSKEFILQRTLKDVVPHLNKYLKEGALNSVKKSKDPSYLFSQQCKLQYKILNNYAVLLVNLDIQERDLDQILEIVVKYLDSNQPSKLQEAARVFSNQMYEFDPTAVTLKLMSIGASWSDATYLAG